MYLLSSLYRRQFLPNTRWDLLNWDVQGTFKHTKECHLPGSEERCVGCFYSSLQNLKKCKFRTHYEIWCSRGVKTYRVVVCAEMPCGLLGAYPSFGGRYCLRHLQGRSNPEDGGKMFLTHYCYYQIYLQVSVLGLLVILYFVSVNRQFIIILHFRSNRTSYWIWNESVL